MTDSALIPATELFKLYRNKRLSPVEVARVDGNRIVVRRLPHVTTEGDNK